MNTKTAERQSVETFEYLKEVEIAAPVEVVFETILGVLGPDGEMPGGEPYPMTIEPWPGGRWFRDLGNGAGHLWAHVQAIKPPTLLELCGPLMMSFASANNIQYRLTAEGDGTRLVFHHRAMGTMPPEYLAEMPEGWEYWIEQVRKRAEEKRR
jgi:uncharacterized protein YndB with AHSA1/START domain